MKRQVLTAILCVILVFSSLTFVQAEDSQDWSKYTWDLTEFFPSNEAFLDTCSNIQEAVQFMNSCKGKLHNPDTFIQFNNTIDAVYDNLLDVVYYSMLAFQKNYTSSEATASYVKANDIYNSFFAAYRMFNNEIATMDDAKFAALTSDWRLSIIADQLKAIREDPANADYNEDKKLISDLNTISDFESIYSTLKDGELGGTYILDETGNLVPASSIYLSSPVESVRKDALDALNYPYLSKQNTFASLYDKHVRQSLANNKYNGYDSTLSAQLDLYEVSRTAYDALMSTTMDNLDVVNEKYNVQRKALGYEKTEEYNLYQSYLPSVQKTYTMEEARELIIAASQPLGEEYISVLNKAFDEHWIDAKPGEGKYSGGFTLSTPRHPFILVNFYGTLGDVGDLAHELGHAVHIYLSSQNQPVQYQNTPYVTSEIASTVNETLFYRYMLEQAENEDETLYYTAVLENYIFGYGIEVMKQAIIEENAQEAVLNGEVLTADFMNQITLDVLQKFYGESVNVADSSKIYWATIPHFYTDFYVFNYAMSYSATNMIVKNISDGTNISEYLAFLKAGSSQPALELIKAMGVDMESAETYQTLYSDYSNYLEEERLLLARNGQQMDDAGQIQVVYHGELMQFDTAPQSIEYVTMVDAEAALQQMGAEVSIENGVLTAVSSGKELIFREGEQNASVNGTSMPMQWAAQNIGGKLFVPIRFIAEQFDLSVSYNDRTRTVVLK